jgi:hypothetical protein
MQRFAHIRSVTVPARVRRTIGKKTEVILESKRGAHLGTVNRFVTTGRPARPLLEEARVIYIRHKNMTVAALLLKVALYTERLVAFR